LVEDETLRDRLGEPEDIAEVVAFLASPAARNITGQVLVADGGCASHVPGIAGFRAFFGRTGMSQYDIVVMGGAQRPDRRRLYGQGRQESAGAGTQAAFWRRRFHARTDPARLLAR
jgi:hypothetical protein